MNVLTCCRKIPIPYALLSGLTAAGLCLMLYQARPLPGLVLPTVPARQLPEQEPQAATPARSSPKRDPFRPLNHPSSGNPLVQPASGKTNLPPAARTESPKPAAKAAGGRLCGIVHVNGQSKALIRTAAGSLLAGTGDEIPGLGPVEDIRSKSVICQGRQWKIGEVWP